MTQAEAIEIVAARLIWLAADAFAHQSAEFIAAAPPGIQFQIIEAHDEMLRHLGAPSLVAQAQALLGLS